MSIIGNEAKIFLNTKLKNYLKSNGSRKHIATMQYLTELVDRDNEIVNPKKIFLMIYICDCGEIVKRKDKYCHNCGRKLSYKL